MNKFHNSKDNETYGINSCRNKSGFGGGPNMSNFLIDWLIAMPNWLVSLCDMHVIISYLCTNIVPYDSAQLVTKVRLALDYVYRFIRYHACPTFTLLIIVRYPCLINQLSYLLHLISRVPFLGT